MGKASSNNSTCRRNCQRESVLIITCPWFEFREFGELRELKERVLDAGCWIKVSSAGRCYQLRASFFLRRRMASLDAGDSHPVIPAQAGISFSKETEVREKVKQICHSEERSGIQATALDEESHIIP